MNPYWMWSTYSLTAPTKGRHRYALITIWQVRKTAIPSHLTTISSDCRWAVATPLLARDIFVRFIFRHFYSALFQAHLFLRTWPQDP